MKSCNSTVPAYKLGPFYIEYRKESTSIAEILNAKVESFGAAQSFRDSLLKNGYHEVKIKRNIPVRR